MAYARWTRGCDWYIFWQSSGAERREDESLAVWHLSSNPGEPGAQFTFSEISSMLEGADFSPVRGRTLRDDVVLAVAFREFVKEVDEKYPKFPPIENSN